ncbi:peptide deformylase [candidate division KSB1 bacterium]|nr:peptide deformylase [candidate division KSB1 bacterium]RQW05625.1 MAG: peptide deformylase [candidate division KSB1 bacterium]
MRKQKNNKQECLKMALLDVIKYGHPTLRKVAEPYTKEEVDAHFIDDMLETMYEEDGVGLAAPQVNVSKRLIVCSDHENEYVVFNPKIIANSEAVKSDYEGCLSLPGLNAKVERSEKVIVTGKDQNWDDLEIKANGLLAVVFQHEIDHLNGVLYIDRADLSTLAWTDAPVVDETLRQQPTTIEAIQHVFAKKYHKNSKDRVYEHHFA